MRIMLEYFRGDSIKDMVQQISGELDGQGRRSFRIVIFGGAHCNEEYLREKRSAINEFKAVLGNCCVGYVAQRPLDCSYCAEVHSMSLGALHFKEYQGIEYACCDEGGLRRLFLTGISADNYDLRIGEQGDEVFRKIAAIFAREGFAAGDIVRQWNYIERITEYDGEFQRYQQFNDARSRFYASSQWVDGYPAATGIGTATGGLSVDIDAVKKIDSQAVLKLMPIDNSLQTAPHAYSSKVLRHDGSTPKFERAKLVVGERQRILYVSGTAAIRGEASHLRPDATEQTSVTMDNIMHLVRKSGLDSLRAARVYIKQAADYLPVRATLERYWPQLAKIYVVADICRDELLVEIEGFAH
ncbi:MAG: endoribonuclease L-PSP [Bacteroidales bacterium]|nr:endoribonuclease L-PSP [Bacteroidales bacterium]